MAGRPQSGARVPPPAGRLAVLAVVAAVVLGGAAGVAAGSHGPVVAAGTVLSAGSGGPTVVVTEELHLDDSAIFPDDRTVDLSPNATFTSDGATNVTVEEIDGEWTNVTTHDVSTGLEIDPGDKQAVTVEGTDVTNLSVRSVDADASGTADLVYAADAAVDVTVTGLPADRGVEAISTATDSTVATETTDGGGSATFTFQAAELRAVALHAVDDGGDGVQSVDVSGPSGGPGSTGQDQTSTPEPTSTSDDGEPSDSDGSSSQDSDGSSPSDATPTETATEDAESGDEDETATEPPATTESPDQPGFGVVAALVALLGAALVAARRRRR